MADSKWLATNAKWFVHGTILHLTDAKWLVYGTILHLTDAKWLAEIEMLKNEKALDRGLYV
ncbi:MAG: hypothetical protein HYZ44_15095 [Bacteroidetes bacterium]|nr:hypothetical protein [Bacteroidota bacterium]